MGVGMVEGRPTLRWIGKGENLRVGLATGRETEVAGVKREATVDIVGWRPVAGWAITSVCSVSGLALVVKVGDGKQSFESWTYKGLLV